MPKPIELLILCALPASGKSETRKFLANLTPEEIAALGVGKTDAQCDDYPYVHLMRTIDNSLAEKGQARIFYGADHLPFTCPWTWLILIDLLNEDFHDLVVAAKKPAVEKPMHWIMHRIATHAKKYPECKLERLEAPETLAALEGSEADIESRKVFDELYAGIPDTLEGRTVVMEFARGGPEGATFPLPAPLGYLGSLSALSDEVLSRASVLYIYVTPEQSYQKNIERGQVTSTTTSTLLSLNHSVPHDVMKGDYGTDDLVWLGEQSDRPGFLHITSAEGTSHYVPYAALDNRDDLTTPFRQSRDQWPADAIEKLKTAIEACFKQLRARE